MEDFQTLINANIFFFITTISVILLTGVLIVALIYLAQVLRNIRDLTQKAKTQADFLAKDISELRTNVKKEGMKLRYWWDFVSKLFKKPKKPRGRR